MSKQAFDKIAAGLDEAALVAPYVAEITNLRAESRRDADEIALLRFENEKLSALVSQLSEKVVRLKLALNGISEE